jgi:hypothetical protein
VPGGAALDDVRRVAGPYDGIWRRSAGARRSLFGWTALGGTWSRSSVAPGGPAVADRVGMGGTSKDGGRYLFG